jgi:hypothetical protein
VKDKKYILKCNEKCAAKKKLENDQKNSGNKETDEENKLSQSIGLQSIQPVYFILLAVLVLFASILAFYFLK